MAYVCIRLKQLGGETKKIARGHLDVTPSKGEQIVYEDKRYEVVQVIHGLWPARTDSEHGKDCIGQEVTVQVVEVPL